MRIVQNGSGTPFFCAYNAQNHSIMEPTLTTAKVRKRISESTEARQSFTQFFRDDYPPVRQLKIIDGKYYFIAHAKAGKRYLYAKAYSLERLKEYFILQFKEKVVTMA